MSYDALRALRDGGSPVDALTDAQKEVISTLTLAEVDILNDVQRRMAVVSADVEGHLPMVGVVVF